MVAHKLIFVNKPNETLKPTTHELGENNPSTHDLAVSTEDIVNHTTRLVNSRLGGSEHVPIN